MNQQDQPLPDPALLTIRQVCARTSLSRTLIYKLIKAGTFPEPVKVSPGVNRWRAVDIEAWIAALEPGAANRGDDMRRDTGTAA